MLDLETNAEELLDRANRAMRFDPQIGPALSDEERQDLASDTYERLLRRHRDGRIYNGSLIALTQKTALNLARNYLAHRNFQGQGDPTDESFVVSGEVLAPDETLFRKVDLAGGIEAAEQLPEEQLRVYRALVVDELTPTQAIKRLKMRRSTFFKYRKLAFDHVTSALLDGDDSPAARERLKLLAAYDAGIANARQRARARRLLKNDPSARAELLALRRGHRVAAVGLPMLLTKHQGAVDSAALADRFADAIGRARDAVSSLHHRGGAEGADATAAVTGSGVARGAGVAGAGVLAKVAALGTGGQVAAACIAGGGATLIACVATGVIALPGPSDNHGAAEPTRPPASRVERQPVQRTAVAPVLPSQVGHDQLAAASSGDDRPSRERAAGGTTAAETAEPVLVPTAPATEQEFGAAAAATPASGPAPADTNDSNGASGGTVRQEFGP